MTSMQSSTSLSQSGVATVAPLLLADEESFETFYAEHVAFVWRNLKRFGIAAAELEDVCQEVFVTVHRRWTSFEARATPRSWLYGIVRRVAWRHRRGSKRRERRHAAFDVPRRYQTGEPAVASRVLALRLQQFLEQLDDDKRDVFVLAELEELTAPEIAERVGVGPNTVYSRLRAARAAFETKFGPLPRQRDAVRRVHEEDAPTEEQRNRMLVVIIGFPTGARFESTGAKVGIPVGVAAAVAVVLTWAAGPAAVPGPDGVVVGVSESESESEPASEPESVGVDVDESVDVDVDVDVDVGVDVTELPAKVGPTPERRRRAEDLAPVVVAVAVEEPVEEGVGSLEAPVVHPNLDRLSRDSAPVVETEPKIETEPEFDAEPQPDAEPMVERAPEPAVDSARIQLERPNRATPEMPDTSGLLDPAELSLLQSARQALDAGNPRRALARIREHGRRFGDSALSPERDATAAEAHCALGHERSARPYLQRLERGGQGRLAKTIRERCD